jgi:aspartate racemase
MVDAMKRMGVLGGMSPQATMDFEASVHRASQRLVPPDADFLVIPCNTAHIGLPEITEAAGCPVLSMIDVTLDDVMRRGGTRVGVLGFSAASPLYLEPLRQRGIRCETIDATAQARLDAAIRAVMGRT